MSREMENQARLIDAVERIADALEKLANPIFPVTAAPWDGAFTAPPAED